MMMMMMVVIFSGNKAIASRCLQKDQWAILYSAPGPPKYSLTSHDDGDDDDDGVDDDKDDDDAAVDDCGGGGTVVIRMMMVIFPYEMLNQQFNLVMQYSIARIEVQKMRKSLQYPSTVQIISR